MNTFRVAAIEILRKSDKPLHYKEITKKALESGLIQTIGKTPAATMNSRIITDINVKGSKSDFLRVGPGIYILNAKKGKQEFISVTEQEIKTELPLPSQLPINTDNSLAQKVGEYLAAAQLLLHNVNSTLVNTKNGPNIISIGEEKLYGISVSTSFLNELDEYLFDFSFITKNKSNTTISFYIFVFLSKEKHHFLILPSHEIDKLYHEDALLKLEDNQKYQARIRMRGKKMYIASKEYQMGYYLDNWEIIQ